MKTTIKGNLVRYLGFLYEDFESQKVVFSSDENRDYEVYYTKDGTEVRSVMNSISILSSNFPLAANAVDTDVLNNRLVAAAISYLGLTNPKTSKIVEYGADGTESSRTYKITDSTNDTFQQIYNSSFKCITVQKYADSNNVIVKIGNVLELTKYADYPVLSYSSVLAKLTEYYPKISTKDIEAEIYYSATVQPGYFVPCYRFYFKNSATAQSVNNSYTYVDVLLTDKSVND